MVTRDHLLSRVLMREVLPKALRRRLQIINIVYVGARCNTDKGAMTLYKFIMVEPATSKRARHLWDFLARLRSELPLEDFLALTGAPR